VVLDSTYDVRIAPGAERVFAHRLRNAGELADDFVLSAAAPAGWTVSLVRDADGDGRVGAGELPVSAPVRLAPGEHAGLLLVVTAPFGAAPGTQAAVFVRAASVSNPSVSAEARDVLTIQASAARLTVVKTVDRATATGGDTLSYSIAFSNNGDGATGAVVLEDSLPAGLRLVPGSLRLNGAALTDADDGDAGRAAREVVAMSLGALAAGQGGTATFRAVVAPNLAPGTLANVAVLRDGTGRVASAPAITAVELPALRLSKERVGADTVRAGGEVSFRLHYGNLSTRFAVRALELVDSLPNGLAFVSSDRPSTVDGQVVRWSLGDLAAGDSGVVTIVARVTTNPADGAATLLNRAVVSAANATAVSAAAAPLQVTPYGRDDLKLTKSAGVLEVAIGDAIPYTIVMQNRGAAPLHDVVLIDHLPEGTRLIQRVVEGVDSMRVEGRTVRFFVAGPIAAGASRTVRYAVLVMSPGRSRVLVNRASAIAQNGEVRTAEDSAVVRMRRPAGLQVQALIGKVWLDRNGNGRQERGEEGVRGMEVVSADGQLVTTDAEGRFTFPEMAAGVHLVRLDMLRVPEGFTVARAGDDQVVIRADGWTIPRVNFRLVPLRGAA
ncbi:MAG: DUF11 domain-containing protein, partial [Gemmatimonadetes bacterium]|nr:DUF11 domain-containing protein [Gemmatimonadota bacterium]